MKSVAKAMSLGFTVCCSLLFPILIGTALDKHFGSHPVGVLIGLAVGILMVFGALWELIRS